ncbi:MAG: hypothetical protein HFF39_03230 [Lawsonibacter sp.]|nr:hypothetical protein [Lawsonibacter sp.]
MSVNTQSAQEQFGDYLSRYDVAGYLGIGSDEADILREIFLEAAKDSCENLPCLAAKFPAIRHASRY